MNRQQHQFLVEIGTEELPPTSLLSLSRVFADEVSNALAGLEVSFDNVQPFATPRRLAIRIEGLPDATPLKEVTVWGPPAKIAFDADGEPTKAALAFAQKNRLEPGHLQTASDGKVDKLVARNRVGGQQLTELLPTIVNDALSKLPISKRMRWGSSREEFVRPVHWLVMLFDSAVVPCSLFGLRAGMETHGHRFHANRAIELAHPQDYEQVLRKEGYVVADFAERRELIRQQVREAGEALGGIAVIGDDLLDEVTALVEWPVALAGQFEERFLDVPAEALISSMKEHQKYFHVVDAKDNLLPYFITVANLASEDPAQVIAGNEKVIRPRLSDAAFFFTSDQKIPLAQHREKLKNVVFQAKLGTVYDKTDRVARLAEWIAEQLGFNSELAKRAGQLSKADLATSMVYEFADMQGIAGQYYARHDGEPEPVAQALCEQYLPKFAGDELPSSDTGTVVALADRLDTLAGIFGLGQIPTGSKDPFALRRASLAVLRILVEKGFDLDLRTLLEKAVAFYPELPKGNESVELALTYMLERFRAWYEERDVPVVVYQAVAKKGLSCPLDIDKRVHAVAEFYRLPEAEALAAANKRVSNIIAKLDGAAPEAIDEGLLTEPAERALFADVSAARAKVTPLFNNRDYSAGLMSLAQLRKSVDRFFDDVMVMVEDEKLRANRLALLNRLRQLFWEVADISQLARQ